MGRPGRRHYRVAQRETEEFTGTTCSCKDKKKAIAVLIFVSYVAFIKGCLFTYLLTKNRD